MSSSASTTFHACRAIPSRRTFRLASTQDGSPPGAHRVAGQEHFLAYSATNVAQARINFTKYGKGVGFGVYWFTGGPSVDPHYDDTTAEATSWGAQQAARALSDIANGGGVNYPVVWADIELPGITPARDRHRLPDTGH